MKSFEWDSCYETGLDDVDEQHQYLVEVINRYGALIAQNNISMQDIRLALFELSRYAEFHFKEEENLMRTVGVYDKHVEEHIKIHRAFMADILSMQAFINDGNKKASEHLLNFLIHWLAYHILGIDQNMSRQVKQIESGVDPKLAWENEEKKQDASTEPLLKALNGLFDQVSERNKELLELNQSLEDKVLERTKQLSRVNKQLEELSLTDSLTKLPNRRCAIRKLKAYWQESTHNQEPLVCIMIDVDYFKQVNDTAGHDAGDRLLVELSHTLADSFRSDDLVCRLGGDEFFVICPNTDLAGGMHIAELTRNKVNQMLVPVGESVWRGSISVGVGERTPTMNDFNDLIKEADNAVYLSKSAGRNRVSSTQDTASELELL
ncbi:GGDEF domain-containing protein [Vibrio brasiliensis]|uniref:diguanylate cyclase n=1 Tax=Vibrio brasiliensis LMG 20546 TaxID=945543 RepID=E8LVY4_9VIBR|nr:GGDEF domain-containing protein [Vibrio brasiliensis]EGA65136.1 GGDEF family protein [Vibrio brasiliensis LMG 20546]MCG9648646.1 GGDEF domain-containing protein [Vibrio brasiliensis]